MSIDESTRPPPDSIRRITQSAPSEHVAPQIERAQTARPRSILCPESPGDLEGRLSVMRNRITLIAQTLDAFGYGDFDTLREETMRGLAEIAEGVGDELKLFHEDYTNEYNALDAKVKATCA